MQNKIIDAIERAQEKKRPAFQVGDRVVVNIRLKEGDKERLQAFRGVVIAKQPKSGRGPGAMFTVRKVSEGVGVEKIFPIHSPSVDSIEVETSSEVRRSRLYYLRELKGKKARLKEAEKFGDLLVQKDAPAQELMTEQGTEITGGDAPAPTKEPQPKK
ncbi:MAG: 50S ribosomal protein L19 [Proteobacteria bacterium]|nr:50S ribosomal protein L19 [Pseudomonadota bacterium]NDG25903.1 50S ribosomal protein L19 [Pseudomonadota bacterium]